MHGGAPVAEKRNLENAAASRSQGAAAGQRPRSLFADFESEPGASSAASVTAASHASASTAAERSTSAMKYFADARRDVEVDSSLVNTKRSVRGTGSD
jgi:hypothetical protein